MSARREAGAKRGAGVGAVARARIRGKGGREAGTPVGAGAGVAAEARGARGGASAIANLAAARRRKEMTKNVPGLGLDPDLNPRKRSI